MRSLSNFLQHAKTFLKNLAAGIVGIIAIGTTVTIGVFLMYLGGNFYEMFVSLWVRGTIVVSIVAIFSFLLLAKFGEKILDGLAEVRATRRHLSR